MSTDHLLNLVHHHIKLGVNYFLPCMGSYHPYLNPFRLLAYFSIHHSLHLFLALFYISSLLSSLYVSPVYSATLVSPSLPVNLFLQIEHADRLDLSLSIRRGTLKQTKIPMSNPESKGEYDMLTRRIKPESRKEKV